MTNPLEDLLKVIGDNHAPTTVSHWLNTGHPLLNDAISGSYHGGMPSGRIVEMFGPASCGKTAIATEVMIAAQKAGGVAAFMDHENSFDHNLATSNGLDPIKNWIFRAPDTFEESIALTFKAVATIREKKMIDPKAPIVFVYDSLASMVPKSKFGKDVDEYNMNDTTALARATSSLFPSLSKMAEKFDFLALFLNQVRVKPGVVYGNPETTPGGSAPEYYASVRLSLKRAMMKDKKGQTVKAECVKNKVHKPFEKAEWDFVFTDEGTGRFDPVGSVLDHLVEIGVVTKAGHRLEWDGQKLFRDDVVDRINKSGDRVQLYKLLPGWDADRANASQKIDWNA